MEQAAFIRAILDEPDEDAPRLVFADWLEENGQESRAAWIRASCRSAKLSSNDPEFGESIRLELDSFRRCRPEWWQEITGVTPQNNRGLYRFEVGSKTAATRLGKVRWLGTAHAEGWLEGISIGWCDGSLARVLAGWEGDVRGVPLFVRPAPQISDEGLAFYLGVPNLWGLTLPGHATRHPAIRRLGQRSDLRELHLEGMPEPDAIGSIFERIGQLTGLWRLQFSAGNNKRPTDDDLRALGGLTGLRELHLDRCRALTDAALAWIPRLTGLRRLKIWGCPGVSPAAVDELRRARPALEVQQL